MSVVLSLTRWFLPPLALLLCGAAWAAEDAAREPGPWVELSLKSPAEKVTGFLIQSQGGTLTLAEKGGAQKDFAATRVESLNFERPPKDQTKVAEATPEPRPPEARKKEPETRKKEDTPKEGGDRPLLGDRFPRREFWRKRALDRLTPDERKRFDELLDRFLAERKEMPQAEADEFKRLFEKLDIPDPAEYHQQVQQALKEARLSQELGSLDKFVQGHQEKLAKATTEDERRRHMLGVFAAQYIQGVPPEKFIPRTVESFRQSDPRAREKPPDKLAEMLRDSYDLFVSDAKRPAPDRPPLFPLRPRLGDKPKAP